MLRRTAGALLALAMMACTEMVEEPKVLPQVAGTYEGETIITGWLPLKLPTTATVTQSEADVTVVLRTTFAGQTSEGPPLKGKIDEDGNVSVADDDSAVFDDDSNQICGALQHDRPDLSFRDDELRLTANARSENCGTITATLIAKKT